MYILQLAEIIGPAAAGSAGPVPPALVYMYSQKHEHMKTQFGIRYREKFVSSSFANNLVPN